MKKAELLGQRFGRLIVIALADDRDKGGRLRWICRCDCGTVLTVQGFSLSSGRSQSCGCKRRELSAQRRTKHGMGSSKEYRTWANMLARVKGTNGIRAKDYTGRGIGVDPRWYEFENFLADMGLAPSPNHTLDRVDNDGHYEPSNCRWATSIEQANNKRSSRLIELDGSCRTVAEWSRLTGIPRGVICARIDKQGWDVKRALTQGVKLK